VRKFFDRFHALGSDNTIFNDLAEIRVVESVLESGGTRRSLRKMTRSRWKQFEKNENVLRHDMTITLLWTTPKIQTDWIEIWDVRCRMNEYNINLPTHTRAECVSAYRFTPTKKKKKTTKNKQKRPQKQKN